jgi:hypothetical protein
MWVCIIIYFFIIFIILFIYFLFFFLLDPHRAPTTEEIEEYGEDAILAIPNIARDYINSVRRRKGLLVWEKIVDKAEKQKFMSNA